MIQRFLGTFMLCGVACTPKPSMGPVDPPSAGSQVRDAQVPNGFSGAQSTATAPLTAPALASGSVCDPNAGHFEKTDASPDSRLKASAIRYAVVKSGERFHENWHELAGIIRSSSWERATAIRIYWWSASEDGHLFLEIAPSQVSLLSGHDNPRESHVYWTAPLSAEQYGAALLSLDRGTEQGPLSNCRRSYSENALTKDCAHRTIVRPMAPSCDYAAKGTTKRPLSTTDAIAAAHQNLLTLLTILNQRMKGGMALPVPSVNDLSRKVLLAGSHDELVDWLRLPEASPR